MTGEIVSKIFTGREIRLCGTWRWLHADFAEEFHQLTASGADRAGSGGEVIWKTRHKCTLKIQTAAGRVIACKQYSKLRLFPYLYHCTPTAREAVNYQRLAQLGLPMAKLLAVGDERCFFRPRSSFIVTEFAENCQDGRAFYPGGRLESETAWRDEFCRRNFELIAKLHDAGIYHRGFTPANELWRRRSAPDENGNLLDIIWIDVASCRKLPSALLRKKIPEDFVNFLRFFQFSEEQHRIFLQAYCDAVKVRRFEPEELFSEVKNRLKERLRK